MEWETLVDSFMGAWKETIAAKFISPPSIYMDITPNTSDKRVPVDNNAYKHVLIVRNFLPGH